MPCINAGTNVPFEAGGVAQGVTTDLDGNPRILGDRVDMGAYEIEPKITDLIRKFQKLAACMVSRNAQEQREPLKDRQDILNLPPLLLDKILYFLPGLDTHR